ncbi:MAG: Ig-like domain-containing protein [Clostridiales bacterium]|nr:Ig-like domain-containing protein [Clostridiales bacterium]
MQNKKQGKKNKEPQDLFLEELLVDEEGIFDDEDGDSVTEDTLEFLSLDDDMIEAYHREHGASGDKSPIAAEYNGDREEPDDGYEEEEYEDGCEEDAEEYEDGYEDEDEEYEDGYEDEDEEYEDDYEEDADEGSGVIVRFRHFLASMSTLDMVVAILGIVVLAGVFVTGGLYVNAKTVEKQVEAFASVGEEIEGISVIGEGGLLAVSESAKLAGMVGEEEQEEEDEDQEFIQVSLRLTSVQSDLKIKFINQETEKLIGSVPFEVEVTNGSKTYDLKDEDKDGIIYQTGIESGTYQVTVKPFSGDEYQEYKLPSEASTVEVTDQIAYKKVDVADEIKSESEVNAAIEDTAQQDTAEESALTDTVEWVESTKTLIGDGEVSYEEVPKSKITDPWTVSSAYRKLVEESSETVTVTLNKSSVTMEEGGSASLQVSVSGSSDAYTVTWGSTDTSVATVSDGSVSGVGAGSATITAEVTVGSLIETLSCSVTVTEASDDDGSDDDDSDDEETVYTKVTVSGTSEVTVGSTVTLTATTTPTGGSVTWSSGSESVATVTQSGVVTGVAAGTAKIKAVCGDASASFTVTVSEATTVDGSTKLKDQDGNQMYYLSSSGEYKEATYDDYNERDTFYKKVTASQYKYTGWQTIDGYVYFYDKDGNVVTGEQVIQGAKYSFGSDGRLASGSGTLGIDVSKWNGSIDWSAVKNAGVSYVIIRCGYRGSSTGALIEDPKFKTNIKGAKAAGLKVGVYFFSQATNEVEAVEEASMAINLVSGYGLNYPIFLDVESSGGRGDAISKETRTAVCKAFCATVQNSGYTAGIYANKTWLTEKINTSSLTGYKIWLAQYASSPTYTATRYDMWQYSSKGSVSGISGNVDMNISYLNY